MGLIERLKILLKNQEKNVRCGVSRKGNLGVLIFLYPLIFLMIYAAFDDLKLPVFFEKFVLDLGVIIGIVSILLTVWDCFKKNQFLVGLSAYFIGVYAFFTLPISVTTAFSNGNLNFILLQEVSITLWPLLMWLSMAYFTIDSEGNMVEGRLQNKILGNLFVALGTILCIYGLVELRLSDTYLTCVIWGFELIVGLSLVTAWSYILYPLRHKDDEGADLTEASEVQSKAVNALNETLQDKRFDKERFK
ncbi:hypothetical protein SAMN05216347_10369 [Streptococcus equinus]|uniref:Uncharacterized protein n=1 Tax=Streptococcus equinus TaxID=1335 RepID=A0A1H0NDI1_STREI|nr:hypothetical protein [Streptococcus equinus]SDO90698.1 hypothetical protein SAMN05216347_10369 [Streptococcus equinus]